MEDYRTRIYRSYVNARQQPVAPVTLDGLNSRAPYLNKVIRDHFPQDKEASILDLGCGHGAFVFFARKAGYSNVIGVDRSPEQVREAQRLGIEGVHEGDLIEVLRAMSDGSQDAVISFDVIEHFNKDEMLPLVDEVHRVLRKGGRWIVHVPNGESPFCGRIRYGDFTHEQIFTRQSISQLLLSSGFTDVRCFEDKPIVHGMKSALRRWMWEWFRLLLRLYLAVETGSGEREAIFSQNFLVFATRGEGSLNMPR